jgi:hypothetical protein
MNLNKVSSIVLDMPVDTHPLMIFKLDHILTYWLIRSHLFPFR